MLAEVANISVPAISLTVAKRKAGDAAADRRRTVCTRGGLTVRKPWAGGQVDAPP